jgi:hypothetical protein
MVAHALVDRPIADLHPDRGDGAADLLSNAWTSGSQ